MNITEIIKQTNYEEDEKNIIDTLVMQIKQGSPNLTVRKLAKLTYCSPSKIVRFAKKLGFYGYSDMLFSFRKHEDEKVELKVRDSLSNVIILEDSLKIIDQMINDLTSKKYNNVYLQGLGYSHYICEYFRDKLVELGIPAFCMNPQNTIKDKKDYILIVISNSGETEDLLKIVKECSKEKAQIYAISSQLKSRLCKNVSNHIIITQKNTMNLNQIGSYFAGNVIILIEKISEIINETIEIGDE